MTYDAVVLDMDGVLVDHTPREDRRAAALAGFAAVGVDPAEGDVEPILRSSAAARTVAGRIGFDVATFYDAFDPALRDRQLATVPEGAKPAYPDVEVLPGLGVALGVASNNYDPVVAAVLERDGLAAPVGSAHGTEPGAAGRRVRKPEPDLLERAIADLGAERPLFVGDSPADLGAARAAGVDFALVDRPGDDRRPVEGDVEYEIESLRELRGIVD